ncbi:MAG: hypothetical protein KC731_40780, partial [Myxococcales bacterium]|nr:hypothetical protein [Myxococcales bacterium]
ARRAVSGFALVAIICGVLFILTALPPAMLGIDDATALESPRGLDALGMLLGGLALSAGLAARFRPSRFALVANAAWCIGAAIDTGSKVTTGESSPVWLAGAAMLLALAWGQIRIYFLVGELPKESLPDV